MNLTSMQKKILSTVIALIVIMGVFGFLTDGLFFGARNISNLLRQTSINGILAVGMTYVILLGGIDLSLGSVVAVVGILVAISQTHWGLGATGAPGLFGTLAIAAALSGAIGVFNAALISGLGIHSFVITFGMMVIARGLAMILSNGQSISPMGPLLNAFGEGYLSPLWTGIVLIGAAALWIAFSFVDEARARGAGFASSGARIGLRSAAIALVFGGLFWICASYQGLPIPVLVFGVIAFLGSWVLTRTRFGRYVYAVGGNAEAARLAGIPVRAVTFSVFVLMSLLAGLSGVLLTARLNGATPTAGNLFELDAIAAVVIGGTSLMGGKGSVLGSLIGALIIASLNNGMSLMNISDFYQMPLKGLIVILAVAMDSILEKKRH